MTVTANPERPRRWIDRAFQIRLPVFVVIVAGMALVFWAGKWYLETRDPWQAMTRQQMRDLTSKDVGTRRSAADLLDGVQPAILGQVSPLLMAAMKDPDAIVRRNATRSLASSVAFFFASTNGQVPPDRDAAGMAILSALRDPDASVRSAAAQGMRIFDATITVATGTTGRKRIRLGLDPAIVLPALRAMLDDRDVKVASAALQAIQRSAAQGSDYYLDPGEILPQLRRLAHESDTQGRVEAISWLAAALNNGGDPPGEVIAFLDDPSATIRTAVINALASTGKGIPAVGRMLADRLAKGDPAERSTLINEMVRVRCTPDDAVPMLIRFLDGPNEDVKEPYQRQSILENVPLAIASASSEAARSAIPALFRAIPRQGVGRSSIEAILRIGPSDEEGAALAARLAGELDRAPEFWRNENLGWLGRIGPPAMPELLKLLDSRDRKVRDMACASLEKFGPDAAEALAPLAALAREKLGTAESNAPAFDALFAIGPGSPEAGSVLVELVDGLSSSGHREHLATILRVLDDRGVDPTIALKAYRETCTPDGAARVDAALKTMAVPR